MSAEIKKIQKAAKEASAYAIREAKALGLTVRIVKDGEVFDIKPDGTKEKISGEKRKNLILKKGTVLRRVKA